MSDQVSSSDYLLHIKTKCKYSGLAVTNLHLILQNSKYKDLILYIQQCVSVIWENQLKADGYKLLV